MVERSYLPQHLQQSAREIQPLTYRGELVVREDGKLNLIKNNVLLGTFDPKSQRWTMYPLPGEHGYKKR